MKLSSLSFCALAVSCALVSVQALAAPAPAAPRPPVTAADELGRLDLLPRFRQSAKVGMDSSYDRTGGNDDGFSGRYSFIRKETDSRGEALVVADLKGPGVITRIWTPTPTDDPMEFYFDGEAAPRITSTFRNIFTGGDAPFLAPLSGFGGGGFWTYVPLPYAKSCKVLVRGPRVQFYQINHAAYPAGTAIRSYDPKDPEWLAQVARAKALFEATGGDLSELAKTPDAKQQWSKSARTLAPGKTVRLFEAKKGGRIVGIRLSPASAFAGKDRAVLLRAYWDGDKQPAILAPAGDFFGYSWGDPAARSLPLGTDGNGVYCWLPMPYEKSARLELVDERKSGAAVEIRAEVLTADAPKQADEGRFYAVWSRENPTTDGKPFTWIDTDGRGHVVGVTVQAQGKVSGLTPFFEGDDEAIIDGEMVAHGTGSEDFFNGGWYDVPGRWETRLSLPLSGCLDYKKHLARSGAYRFFIADAYPFQKHISLTIEHGPEKNAVPSDYAGMVYLYCDRRPTMATELAAVESRRVVDLERLIFVPGWTIPMHSFSMERAVITKKTERFGGREERYFSMRCTDDDIFGQHHVAFRCEIPAAGRYRVSIRGVLGPEQGIVQLFRNEGAVGPKVDLFAAEKRPGASTAIGELDLREGENPVFLKLVGKNAQSAGLGLDLISLEFERVK